MSDALDRKTVLVRIEGRVQGVGFRAWVERTAIGFALTGWVRNQRDGSVAAVFQGTGAAVDAMVARCSTGPRASAVSKVETSAATGTFTGFEILPTE